MTPILERSFDFDLRARLAAFALAAASVYAVAFALVSSLDGFGADAALLAVGVTLDLVIVVPALYWLLVVRGGAPRVSLVPVCLLSLAAAGAIVPREHHGTLGTIEALALPLEIGVVAYLFWSVHRAWRLEGGNETRGDVVDRLRAAASRLLGEGRAAEILAFEAAVLYFAFASWRRRTPLPGEGEVFFTHHRKALYSAAFVGVLIAGLVEVVAVHWLVGRWSETAAWILTALSIYGLVWLVGDYRAIVLRPSRLAGGRFELRLGLRRRAEIPLDGVRSCRKIAPSERPALRARKDVLEATLLGEPSHLLELEAPVEVLGPYGMRRFTRAIALAVDQERELARAFG